MEELPEFEIKQLVSVQAVKIVGDDERCGVSVELTRDDVPAFRAFCDRHAGRQVVLIYDNEPIATPLVGPVEGTTRFEFKLIRGDDCSKLADTLRMTLLLRMTGAGE